MQLSPEIRHPQKYKKPSKSEVQFNDHHWRQYPYSHQGWIDSEYGKIIVHCLSAGWKNLLGVRWEKGRSTKFKTVQGKNI